MSFKKFSSAQTAPGKDSPAATPKEGAPAEPKAEPGRKPAEATPAPKS